MSATATLERSGTTPSPDGATECGPCTHAREHGWWGPTLGSAVTHCRDCHRSWRSLREGHCATCCRHFADTAAHAAHLRDGECCDPATITRTDGSPRFKLVESPFGPLWDLIGRPISPEQLAKLRERSTPGAGTHF